MEKIETYRDYDNGLAYTYDVFCVSKKGSCDEFRNSGYSAQYFCANCRNIFVELCETEEMF